ncbi:MAG: hypothetical protein SPE73_10170, partial [Prevotella sp.]|nr:hypothetical protein [Prevotella sp.]
VMLKSTCPKHDVHTLQAEKGSADISWGYSDPYGESVLPFLLFRIGLTISVPVLSISHAKLCIRQRKALHPPTQSFASANAKHCICQRKALHLPTQSFASANAKHCSRKWMLFVSSASGVSWFYFFQLTHDFPREYFYIYQILLTFAAVLPKTAL